jgi:hypothetical protein
MTRKAPNMAQKLDAALLALLEAQGTPMPRDEAKGLPDGAVASRFEFDHWPVPVANGGSNHASNLTPRIKAEHREKTAKRDIPIIAKGKRISKAQEAFRARLLAKLQGDVDEIIKGKGARRKAKITSRGFDRTRSRKMDGSVVRRIENE